MLAQAQTALRRARHVVPRTLSLLSAQVHAPASSQYHHRRPRPSAPWILGASVAGLALGSAFCEQTPETEETEDHAAPVAAGEVRLDLPTFSFEEVQKHTGANRSGTWVVYRHGVYDITKFIASHPGGTKILLAAGNSIEPFWQLYAAHNHADVHKILEKLRVGNLRDEDVETLEKLGKERYGDGPYSKDPTRHPALKVNSSMPFNAEPPPELLMQSFITPNDLFFVRNHLPVPDVDVENFTLKISGLGIAKDKQVEFTLDDLKRKFKHHTVTTTIQCAGNRRAEMSGVKQVNGLSWDTTALSTANWTGVLLSDVLASVGVTDEDSRDGQCDCKVGENGGVCDDCNAVIQHVQFKGLDADTEGKTYGASIPVATALDPRKDVVLAFEMNGETIPRDHGYPLRVIVPGTVGARNVKFLHRIVLSSEESPSFWQQRDYKGFPPNVDYTRDDFWKFAGDSIQELPVQSAITEPKNGSVHFVDDATDSSIVTVKGYAWSGGGRNIIRVDISVDGGKTWTPAELHESGKHQKYNRAWAWTPWELDVEVPPGTKKLDILCKAVDASYNVQPDTIAPIWNMRGVLNNAWHRVHVTMEESEEEEDEDESSEDD
ncbi:Sulfite oxidase [Phytophthora fragariae]|uniref:Sulfite oxidase n=1 Tax=Phytophthora fragariae TaxID=53985 RepID=A0A6A4C816_9STRA|nr:Sulfite oxidase [Phytophthora fragariae]KAE8945956.1 Sulfite oxidase [Phytophthora fragariae]KAE9081099.1 Sulfite oxidase [Phytophthora fragariae]KAE9128765.1 Sulfite oxidase [Phytophthora fragariae]KAE9229776.1 Sulfite oxidase [Phytophthora fragariae]